jgi:hypothetical protein
LVLYRLRAIWRHQYGVTPTQKFPDNSGALGAFIASKTEIDTILARIAALSAEHFNRAPDDVTWADVGTLGGYLKGLREVSDAAFQEGEYAA